MAGYRRWATLLLFSSSGCGLTERDPEPPMAECRLELVASGELPRTPAAGSRFSGPGLAATDDAFVLAWRENLELTHRLIVTRLDDSGETTEIEVAETVGCGSNSMTPGLGAVFAETGLIAAGVSDCNPKFPQYPVSRLFLVPFDGREALGTWSVSGGGSQAFLHTSAQPVAPTRATGEHYAAYVVDFDGVVRAELGIVGGNSFKSQPPLPEKVQLFDGAVPGFVNLAASDSFLALAGSIPAAGAGRWQLFDTSWPPQVLGERTLPAMDWVALAAFGTRGALLGPSAEGPSVTVVEVDGDTVVDRLSSRIDAPPPTAGAITTLRDRWFFATTSGGSIRVQQSQLLSTAAEQIATLEPSGYEGELVAIAAARDRVAVAWMNAGPLLADVSPGGWALLECAD